MNELDCMIAQVNWGYAILPGVEKLKHTYLNANGRPSQWKIRLEATFGPGMGGCQETVEIKGFRKTIHYLKKSGWQWKKKEV